MADRANRILHVKQQFEKEWLQIEGVTAVGLGKVQGRDGIVISIYRENSKLRKRLPSEIEGIPVGVIVTGSINYL